MNFVPELKKCLTSQKKMQLLHESTLLLDRVRHFEGHISSEALALGPTFSSRQVVLYPFVAFSSKVASKY